MDLSLKFFGDDHDLVELVEELNTYVGSRPYALSSDRMLVELKDLLRIETNKQYTISLISRRATDASPAS